ncbi:MAG TPA: succinate dehydrogenase/fumarate reductase iron-sulfur subunit [Spirochaetia bacterium]|nr:succinate dehydrogenase/fumarate reductase iron-sulfur subunit [Spirochaetia bacterium]
MRPTLGKNQKSFELTVKRLDPATRSFVYRSFMVEADPFTSVLDLLVSVKEKQDHTLSMRYSCNMGICGSCGMVINGKPRLACETNVFSLGSATISVGPMEAHPMVKDLVTDFDEFFAKHKSVKPWLVREDRAEQFEAKREYVQTRNQVDYFLDFAHCIKCGLCVDACPVSNTNVHFIGPQALGQAYRYNSDSRDQGEADRLDDLDRMDGVWGCEFAGACSEVCPKGVDPALTIQQMKIDLMKRRLLGRGSGEKRAK